MDVAFGHAGKLSKITQNASLDDIAKRDRRGPERVNSTFSAI
jgi:hypothetical protein